jgi:hypothetical protein
MLRSFVRLLYQSTPAEFRSAYRLAESVERLRAATKRSVFSALGETAAVGTVSESGVRLQWSFPDRASAKPLSRPCVVMPPAASTSCRFPRLQNQHDNATLAQ